MTSRGKQIYKYDNKLSLKVDGDMHTEYASCGSHAFRLTVTMDLEDINEFLAQLGIVPLTAKDSFPPKQEVGK